MRKHNNLLLLTSVNSPRFFMMKTAGQADSDSYENIHSSVHKIKDLNNKTADYTENAGRLLKPSGISGNYTLKDAAGDFGAGSKSGDFNF